MGRKRRKTRKKGLLTQPEQKLEKQIYRLFKDNPKKEFSYRQALHHLKSAADKGAVSLVLNDLLLKGKLIETKNKTLRLPGRNKPFGIVVEGVVDMLASGSAYVISPQSEVDIFIPKKFTNRAFNGDKVCVNIFEKKRGKKPEGEITKIIERATDLYVGTVELFDRHAFIVPDRKKMPKDFFLPDAKKHQLQNGQRVVVKIAEWRKEDKNPRAEVVEVLGALGDNDVEMKSILIENGFPLTFPKAAVAEAAEITLDIPKEEIEKRRDIRDVLTLTIDPDDAKDFDDAISLKILPNGHFEIGIHIADVSHYVKVGSALDKAAYIRATSVYLVDRVLPMLPEQLSNLVCSLRPDEEKLTFSAIFEMDKTGKIYNEWFGRTVIKSDRRFTYDEAQERLDSRTGDMAEELKILDDIAHSLREKKFKDGAIAFETQEVKFRLDEMHKPVDVYVKERKEAHMLVEDFMLLANRKVAALVGKQKKDGKKLPFVYRVHDNPDDQKLADFGLFAYKFGYQLNLDTPQQIRASLNNLMSAIHGKPEENVLQQLAIRSMAKAVYTTDNIGHYGLAFDYYTHFTSPIRRYPDVMVHRLVDDYLTGKSQGEKDRLEVQCKHSSDMERKAMQAERASTKFKQAEFMQNEVGKEFDGVISGVTSFGIFVELTKNKCEGLVPLDSMKEDYFTYEEGKYSLVGLDTGKRYQLGDKVRIKVMNTDLEARTIDFELVK